MHYFVPLRITVDGLFLILLFVAIALTGCSRPNWVKGPSYVKPTVMHAFNAKCKDKVIGTAKTTHAAVLVERGCLGKGITSITVMVLKPHPTDRTAQEHTYRLIKYILGFVPPQMYIFLRGKIKKLPYMVWLVGERK